MNRWTLEVSDFGKIGHAKITVSPLTLFLGENNSGKSYLMTLIYGCLTLDLAKEIRFDKSLKEYGAAFEIVKEKILKLEKSNQVVFTLSEEERKIIIKFLNIIINSKDFFYGLFNEEIGHGEIKIECYGSYDFVLYSFEEHKGYSISVRRNEIAIKKEMLSENYMEVTVNLVLRGILQQMLQQDFAKQGRNVIYFPTARTGFLLTYKSVIGSAMQDKFNLETSEKNLLTRPVGDFLTRIGTLTGKKGPAYYPELVSFIEKHLIKGHIGVTEMPAHDILYTSNQMDKSIPMYLTSGVVTELAPLTLFLQQEHLETVLIEEPEISLHPELQISVARLLIRMVNCGISTFVTTHSDLMIQHINNMIRLSDLKKAEKQLPETRYEETDFIDREKVSAYEFKEGEDGKTIVTEIPCGNYGFEVDSFYQTLSRLSEEIDRIEEKLDE